MRRFSRFMVAWGLLVFGGAGSASAATYLVDTTSDIHYAAGACGASGVGGVSGQCSLRAAVGTANADGDDGDTIVLPAGEYDLTLSGANEDANATGDLDVNKAGLTKSPKSLTVTAAAGLSRDSVKIDGQGLDRIFDVHRVSESLTLEHVTLQHGFAPPASGVTDGSDGGSAVRSTGAGVTFDDVHEIGDPAHTTSTSAIYVSPSTTALPAVTFSGSTIEGNTNTGDTIYVGSGTFSTTTTARLTFDQATVVQNNTVTGASGDTVLYAIAATGGAGVRLAVDHATFSANHPTSSTVDLHPTSTASLPITATVTDATFVGNIIEYGTGTPDGLSAGLTVEATTAPAAGSALGITDTTFDGNAATSGALWVLTGIPTTITGSTISNNFASTSGAMELDGDATTISNSTIDGNRLSAVRNTPYATTGILDLATGPVALTHVTLTRSSVDDAPQLRAIFAGPVTVTSSIIAGASANCLAEFGTIVSGGTNIDSGNTCGFNQTGDLTSTDPQLGPLANNGGPTRTEALLTGSPAIDKAASATCPATDQRGTARPQGAACDIGSYELVPPVVTTTPTTPATPAPPPPPTLPVVTPITTPIITPIPLKPAVLTAAGVLSALPSAKACASKRDFDVKLRIPKGVTVVKATVSVNGKSVTVRTGKRLTAKIDLRGFVKGTFKVKIVMTTTTGKPVTGTRTYHTCSTKAVKKKKK